MMINTSFEMEHINIRNWTKSGKGVGPGAVLSGLRDQLYKCAVAGVENVPWAPAYNQPKFLREKLTVKNSKNLRQLQK